MAHIAITLWHQSGAAHPGIAIESCEWTPAQMVEREALRKAELSAERAAAEELAAQVKAEKARREEDKARELTKKIALR